MNVAQCRIADCDKPIRSDDLCQSHRMRLYKYGDPEHYPRGKQAWTTKTCRYENCDDKVLAKGFCYTHYHRNRQGLRMDGPLRKLDLHSEIGYLAAHLRARAMWGRAVEHTCIMCGQSAEQWAYDHTDPTELVNTEGPFANLPYSRYPEFYVPACTSCHKTQDWRHKRRDMHPWNTIRPFSLT